MQPKRACEVRLRAVFGTRLISMLVREYEIYFLSKVEIVGT